MTQMRHGGILAGAAGILTGQFTDCGPKDPAKPSLSVDDVFREMAALHRTPFLSHVPFGHDARKITIPMGLRARLDATKHSLEYLEGAVR